MTNTGRTKFYGTGDNIVSVRFGIQGLENLNNFRTLLSGHSTNVTYVLFNSPNTLRKKRCSFSCQTDLWREIRYNLATNTLTNAAREIDCLKSLPTGALATYLPKQLGLIVTEYAAPDAVNSFTHFYNLKQFAINYFARRDDMAETHTLHSRLDQDQQDHVTKKQKYAPEK